MTVFSIHQLRLIGVCPYQRRIYITPRVHKAFQNQDQD